MRFHIDFNDMANSIVMISYATTTVFVVSSILFFVVSKVATTSLPGSIFGIGWIIYVPGSIDRPFSELEKNEPSTIVVIITSFKAPIDIYCGLSNSISNFNKLSSKPADKT